MDDPPREALLQLGTATPGPSPPRGRAGYALVHSAINGHARLPYSAVHDDETTATVLKFWTLTRKPDAAHRSNGRDFVTGNGCCCVSIVWSTALAADVVKHRRTRPKRPQPNVKVKPCQRTLGDQLGYAKAYASQLARRKALTRWLRIDSHPGPYAVLGDDPPVTRLINLPGQST